jgi:hypothetical protein
LEVAVITGFSLLTFREVAEMLIHPVLQNVEHPELDWLCVLFTEPLQVLKSINVLNSRSVAEPELEP